ncbi:hypothetical protein SAMN05444004_1344 [Jannaschia faecimaris]|uniref:Uncharacterized protein n=1 Tax=Jannaschia faecimaris TaxID=1244108 RepID=A0A1H3UIC6_9RHOB|nr:hypothetical protein SAMN05444004_1344 [Jannaschia faecimaris]
MLILSTTSGAGTNVLNFIGPNSATVKLVDVDLGLLLTYIETGNTTLLKGLAGPDLLDIDVL